jgi:transcriptional regulator with XRE-family HTH domain
MRYRIKELWREWEAENKKKLTHRELARETGLSVDTINRVNRDKSVSTDTLKKLAQFFGVNTRDMLYDDIDEIQHTTQ